MSVRPPVGARLLGTHVAACPKSHQRTSRGTLSVGDIDNPADLAPPGSTIFARPKSSTFTAPFA
jgi:hypothetical protein